MANSRLCVWFGSQAVEHLYGRDIVLIDVRVAAMIVVIALFVLAAAFLRRHLACDAGLRASVVSGTVFWLPLSGGGKND